MGTQGQLPSPWDLIPLPPTPGGRNNRRLKGGGGTTPAGTPDSFVKNKRIKNHQQHHRVPEGKTSPQISRLKQGEKSIQEGQEIRQLAVQPKGSSEPQPRQPSPLMRLFLMDVDFKSLFPGPSGAINTVCQRKNSGRRFKCENQQFLGICALVPSVIGDGGQSQLALCPHPPPPPPEGSPGGESRRHSLE